MNILETAKDLGQGIYDKLEIDLALNGNSTKTFKVADAVNADEALSKGQLLSEIKNVDGVGSGVDADLLDGKQSEDYALSANISHLNFTTQYYQAISSNNGDTEVGGAGVFTLNITTKMDNSLIKVHARHFGESSNAQDLVFNIKRDNIRINTNGDNSLWRGLSMPTQTYGSASNDSTTPEIMELTTIDSPAVVAGTTLTYTLVMARSSTTTFGTYTNRTFNSSTGATNTETGTSEFIIEELM